MPNSYYKGVTLLIDAIVHGVSGLIGLAGAMESIVDMCDEFVNTLLDTPIAIIFMSIIGVIIVLAEKRTVIQ